MSELYPVGTPLESSHRSHRLGAEFEHRANLLLLAGVRETNEIAVHELMHFFEHCSTPYGHFQDEMHESTLELTLQFLREHEGPVFTPLFRWVERFLQEDVDCPAVKDRIRFEELIDRLIKPWSRHKHLWQVLEGSSPEIARQASIPNLVDLLVEIEGHEKGAAIETTFQDFACPSLQLEAAPDLSIGALHVSECIAMVQEGLAGIEPTTISPVYYCLFLLAMDFLAKTKQKSGQKDRHLYLTCLALSDLALFTPIGRTYGCLRNDPLDWSGLHPGWRFCRALEVVAEEDWWITSLFEAPDLGNRICKRLRWPPPRCFLERGSQLTDPGYARHRHACAVRLDDFMAFYRRDRIFESDTPVAKFLSEYLPMIHYPGIGTVCNVPPSDKENATALQQLKNCLLALRYGECMLRSFPGRVLPPDCRFDLYFTNVSSEDDLTRLIVETRPWLQTNRFHRLTAR